MNNIKNPLIKSFLHPTHQTIHIEKSLHEATPTVDNDKLKLRTQAKKMKLSEASALFPIYEHIFLLDC